MRVAAMGASGGVGRWLVMELLEAGYEVAATDLYPPKEKTKTRFCTVDLTRLDEVHAVFNDSDTVVHFGAMPRRSACRRHFAVGS